METEQKLPNMSTAKETIFESVDVPLALASSWQLLYLFKLGFCCAEYVIVNDSLIHQYYPDSIGSADLIANLNGAMINTNFVLDYPRLQPTTFINVLITL